jgi:hypothetical protein
MFGMLFFLLSMNANASTCVLSVYREACPGKETQALAPYQGVNPTTQDGTADTEAGCRKNAEIAAKIVRKRILKKITVTPKLGDTSLNPVFTQERCYSPAKAK